MSLHRSLFFFAALALAGVQCGSTTNTIAPCTSCTSDSDCNGGVCIKQGSLLECATACPNGNECSGSQTCTGSTSSAGDQVSACVDSAVSCSDASVGPPSIGPTGGTESSLFFAVVGDTRPANEDDTANYPTTIINRIFADLAAFSPAPPPFLVSTGDYQYANPDGAQGAAQLQLYLNARGQYKGVDFPAMGNHECTGGTSSNCASGYTTNNFKSFMSMMLGPIQQTSPYYSINVNATDSSWTAKFVFVAANAWDSTQQSWLDSTLSKPTTYTFVVRHEASDVTTTPGVSPSEAIMAKYPYTLAIVGHSHLYAHYSSSPKEVIIGNGGAPISSGQDYGYGIITQRTDGSIQVDMYDFQNNQPDTGFRFAVKADGTPAP